MHAAKIRMWCNRQNCQNMYSGLSWRFGYTTRMGFGGFVGSERSREYRTPLSERQLQPEQEASGSSECPRIDPISNLRATALGAWGEDSYNDMVEIRQKPKTSFDLIMLG
jgi:hypothetical protein